MFAGAVVVLAALPTAVPASAAEPLDAMPDGAWLGSFVYNGAAFAGFLGADAHGSGLFDFVVSGGLVTEGTLQYQIWGSTSSTMGTGVLEFSGVGGVEGSASAPVLRVDSSHISGAIASQGVEVPIALDFGAGEVPLIALEIFTVNCEQVTGNFDQAIASAVAAAGATGTFFGRWSALFNPDPALTPDTIAVLQQLITDAEVIANAAKAGQPIDAFALLSVLDRAEQLAASIPANTACRNIATALAGTFALSVNVVIADLIEAAIANPESLTLTVLQDVVAAGIRTGVLSANAPAGSEAESLSIQLQALFETRLDTALADHPIDASTAQQIMLTALQMGWPSTAQKAATALSGSAGLRRPASDGVIPGLPAMTVTASGSGLGARPMLSWTPVDGAVSYVVSVTVPGGGPLWAWWGAAAGVPYGGGPAADPDTTGAQLGEASTWFVAALDGDGHLLAASAASPIGP